MSGFVNAFESPNGKISTIHCNRCWEACVDFFYLFIFVYI